MKRFPLAVLSVAFLFFLGSPAQAASAKNGEKAPNRWWEEAYLTQPWNSPEGKKLPLISVDENRFVNPAGKPLLLRGFNIADPDKIEGQGRWGRELFVKIKETGATVIRIPVHPIAWRARGPKNYLKLLDQAVQWCTELGIYVDIDWHSIGNLKQGLFQDPMYETSLPETLNFWRIMAAHYNGNHTVAFFELFNEPTTWNGKLGTLSWEDWRQINEDMIAVIRGYNGEAIPLVAGFDWAYDLTPLRINPVRAEHIGYVTHPYPNKRSLPWESKWEEDFGFAASRYPLIATELGYSAEDDPKEVRDTYGPAITNYLQSRGISWIVWCFDPEWASNIMSKWETFQLKGAGQYFVGVMKNANAASPTAGK